METIIKWKTGKPEEYGEYLTTVKSKISEHKYTAINFWLGEGRWYVEPASDTEIIAWYKVSDVEPSRQNNNE